MILKSSAMKSSLMSSSTHDSKWLYYTVDINECKEATGACFNSTTDTLLSSVFSCVNSAGDYSCTCAQGYHHRSGNKMYVMFSHIISCI